MKHDYTGNKVHLDVWGDLAIFTRPELKTERYSYDVMTPSAARNILQQVYWHPSFQFQVTGITVFNPIQRIQMTRNELEVMLSASIALTTLSSAARDGYAPNIAVPHTEPRQQRSTVFLRDVYYGIDAEILPSCASDAPREPFDLKKILAIFNRRAEKGQCYATPYLGIRECTAYFAPLRYGQVINSFYEGQAMDLGYMLFDTDYSDCDNVVPHFYYAVMENGRISIPTQKEVMGNAAFCAI